MGLIHLTDWGFELQLVPPASRQSTKERKYPMILDFIDPKNAPDLVYRTTPHMDSLVFAPLEVALRIDQTHEALGASTWCEFTYLMPIDDLNEMLLERNNPEEDWL